jgi:hypothetical protein
MRLPALPPRLALVLIAAALPGCATFRSYDTELRATLSIAASGQVEQAIKTLDKNNKGDAKDMLYYLEMGELRRLATQYDRSQQAWTAADRKVQAWEAAAKLDPSRVGGSVASWVINDKLRPYEGQDFEKIMLTTRMALNFLALGDFENARVAIKQTHEREALIAEVRRRQYEQVEEEAKKKGARTSFRELNGYPVATLDTPEARTLRNSYQSAFSHYLAGFIYEALGEPSLAAAGYRQAIELRGGSDPLLDDALAGLDQRVAARDDGHTDVLFAIETGLAPARVSQQFSLPIPVNNRLMLVSVSFPVLQVQAPDSLVSGLVLNGQETVPAVKLTSVDAMARRALEDEMPGIMLRGFVRSTTKAVAQYQAQRMAEERRKHGDDGAGAALDIAAIALMIGSAVTESADERGWRSLPATIHVARARVPPGTYSVTLDAPGGQPVQVNIGGRHAFVALRLMGGRLFAMLPPEGAPSIPARTPQSAQAVPAAPVNVSTTMEEAQP